MRKVNYTWTTNRHLDGSPIPGMYHFWAPASEVTLFSQRKRVIFTIQDSLKVGITNPSVFYPRPPIANDSVILWRAGEAYKEPDSFINEMNSNEHVSTWLPNISMVKAWVDSDFKMPVLVAVETQLLPGTPIGVLIGYFVPKYAFFSYNETIPDETHDRIKKYAEASTGNRLRIVQAAVINQDNTFEI